MLTRWRVTLFGAGDNIEDLATRSVAAIQARRVQAPVER